MFLSINYPNHFLVCSVSVPCNVLDCLCYDKGLQGTGNYNPDMFNYQNRLTITRDNEGTLLENNNSNATGYYMANIGGTPSGSNPNVTEFNDPITIEVDIVDYDTDGTNGLFITNDSSSIRSFHFKYFTDQTSFIAKWEYKNQHSIIYIDGEKKLETDLDVTYPLRLGFYMDKNQQLKYRNFKVY